jgi:hypothetical protein
MSSGSADGLAQRQRQFEHFAERECTEDPLYVALCQLLARRPEALRWLDAAAPVQRRPNLLLAALHDRVLAGSGGALAAYFASADGQRPPDDALPAALDALLDDEQEALRDAIARNGTQTNEVGRCAVLWPALGEIARRCGGRPLALLDFGCSAGLNLGVDRYAYRYARRGAERQASMRLGADPAPGVPLIDCHPLHGRAPRPPDPTLKIARRQGLDLNPVDVRDPIALRWLRACLWPQDRARRQRFDQAADIVSRQGWPLAQAADGVQAIERWLDTLQQDAAGGALQPVIFNSWVLAYFGADELAHHVARLRTLVQQRGLAWLSAEGAALRQGNPPEAGPGDEHVDADELARATQWWLTLPGDPEPQARLLARSHPHGHWLQWVAQDKDPVPAGSIIPDPSSK